jgi:uncharacterized membrane protein YjgN (DUF898 family)
MDSSATPVRSEGAVDPADLVAPFSFTGSGGEYFRIWIVNLFLSIVTLGIYSAWAKVRRLQYFYRNTRVAGFAFDYHGNPIAILKGRLIAVGLLGGYYAAGMLSPWFGLAAIGLLSLVLPWLISRSLRFRLYNSSYRGIRFHFSGSTQSAYWVFLGLPVLSVLTLFTLWPLAFHRMKRYQHANAAYGRTMFTFAAPVGEFYTAYIAATFLPAAVVTGAVLLAMAIGLVGGAVLGADSVDAFQAAWLGTFMVAYVCGIIVGQSVLTTRIQNAVWSNMRLGAHGFFCELQVRALFWVMLSNLVLTVATLGLYRPFAQVSLVKYVTSRLTLVRGGNLGDVVASEEHSVGAAGEEAAEMFDFDIGF